MGTRLKDAFLAQRTRRYESTQLSVLEPRVLFSASPIDPNALLPDADTDVALTDADPSEDSSDVQLLEESQSLAARELVIIDSTVHDIQTLLDDLSQSGRDVEVFVLDANSDGVDQISQILDSRSNVESLHIVSHASDGSIQLGNTSLSDQNLDRYAASISHWHQSFAADADLLIYGCNLAESEQGQQLVESLSLLSGADVASSQDDTGHVRYGGNWEFEYATGDIQSTVAFTETAQQNWLGKLASITVTTTLDDISDGGDTSSVTNLIATPGSNGISLREAIIAVNNGTGGDTILLGSGTYNLTLNSGADDAQGDLDIHNDVTIIGQSPAETIIDAGGMDRAFHVHNDAAITVSISGLTIVDGQTGFSGETRGGGIRIDGSALARPTVTLSKLHLLGNNASFGGGVFNAGITTIENSLISGGSAGIGGGIMNGTNGNLSLTNVTISGNSATTGDGGGLANQQTATLLNVTIADNTAAGNGGGIHSAIGASTTLSNTLIAGNSAGTNSDVDGLFISTVGNNLIENPGTATGFNAGDLLGVDPYLGELADNGGATMTHAIAPTSAAANAATATGAPVRDQRGFSRDANPDIGAFEFRTAEFLDADEALVNAAGSNNQTTRGNDLAARGSHQAVAVDSVGNSVVVWSDSAKDGSGWGIFGRRYDFDGNAVGNEFQVNAEALNDQYHASVAMDDLGRFVVVFTGVDAAGTGIFLRRFRSDGTAIDSADLLVNAGQTTGNQINPSIAVNSVGQMAIAWQNEGAGIYARTFDMTSAAVGNELTSTLITVETDSTANEPSVDMNNAGRYVVVWSQSDSLYGRRYDFGNANALSARHDLNLGGANEHSAVVAVQSDNDFVIAYRSDVSIFRGVWARHFQNDGTAYGLATRVSSTTTGVRPSIAMDSSGEFVVVYEDADADGVGIYARRYDEGRSAIDTATLVNQTTNLDQQFASVAMIDRNNYIVAWSGNGDQTGQVDADGVFVRRYGSAVAPNAPTVANPISDQTATQDATFNYQFANNTFEDVNGDTLTYTATLDDGSPLPGWLTFDDSTRTFSGTPTNSDVGSFTVRVIADDGITGTAADEFLLTVSNVNDDPTVANPIADQSVIQGSALSFQFAADAFEDVDGDALSYSAMLDDLSPLPTWLNFDSATRTFSGTPTAGDVGSITVRVTAADGNGGSVFDDFVVTVASTTIEVDSVSTGTTADQASVTVSHQTLGFNRLMLVGVATDPHGESVSSITYNGTALSLVGAEEDPGSHSRAEIWALVAPDLGLHDVVVTMTGTGHKGVTVGVITLNNVDQTTPLLNFASSFGVSTAASVTVTSAPGDLVFGVVHSHNGTDATPGPGQTEYWDLVADQSNSSGTLEAGDTSVETSWTVNNEDWTVAAVAIQAATNSAPNVVNPIPDQTATQDSPFSFQFAANSFDDVDGDSLTYTATLSDGSTLPSWLSFDAATRTFSGTPTNADVGVITVRVTADDGNGDSVADDFIVTINNVNDPPVVANAIADQTATQGTAFSFQFAANTFSDPDGDALTYAATLTDGSPLPAWLMFDSATRTFSGTPTNADVGVLNVRVTAGDGNGASISDDFAITVNNVNDPPVVANAIADQTATQDIAFSFQFAANTFSDLDGDALTYAATLTDGSPLPSWLMFDSATRTFSGTPTNADVGVLNVRVTAGDGNGASISDDFAITVNNVNDPPVVANAIADQTATQGTAFSFQFAANTFSDLDGDALTYAATLTDGSPLPSWLMFDSATRTFSGTPTNADVGVLNVRVTAGDGNGASISDDFAITVNNVNDPPVVANAIADQTATQDIAFSFQVAANTFNDPDGDTLTYTATLADGSALPGWLSFSSATRTFAGTPGNSDVGSITVRVLVDDGNTGTNFDDFQVDILDPTASTSGPDTLGLEGFDLNISLLDPVSVTTAYFAPTVVVDISPTEEIADQETEIEPSDNGEPTLFAEVGRSQNGVLTSAFAQVKSSIFDAMLEPEDLLIGTTDSGSSREEPPAEVKEETPRQERAKSQEPETEKPEITFATYEVSTAAIQALDDIRSEVQNEQFVQQVIVGGTLAAGTSLSVGYVIWLIRGGVLLSSVLSSLPAWQSIDPLPVLGFKEDGVAADQDDSLESLVTKKNKERTKGTS